MTATATAPLVRLAFTPGAYLKARRCAAGLSVADVAAQLACVPRVAEHERADWLEMIEADAQPARWETIAALRAVFPFDFDALASLTAIQLGLAAPPPRLCRICGCSDGDACPGRCGWISADLCSAHAAPSRP